VRTWNLTQFRTIYPPVSYVTTVFQ
jgi:hypothetical protein